MNDPLDFFRKLVGRKAGQAQLPETCRKRTIAEMDIGESAWTVPWAMSADHHAKLWLRGDYLIELTPCGTACLLVRRADDGWHVDASMVEDFTWSVGENLHPAWQPLRVTSAVWGRQ